VKSNKITFNFVILIGDLQNSKRQFLNVDKELHVSHVLVFLAISISISISSSHCRSGWNKLSLIGSFCQVLPWLSALFDLIRCRKKTLASRGKTGISKAFPGLWNWKFQRIYVHIYFLKGESPTTHTQTHSISVPFHRIFLGKTHSPQTK